MLVDDRGYFVALILALLFSSKVNLGSEANDLEKAYAFYKAGSVTEVMKLCLKTSPSSSYGCFALKVILFRPRVRGYGLLLLLMLSIAGGPLNVYSHDSCGHSVYYVLC
jgi:hypothetical protein